jgi:hypothetical protein
MLESHTKIISAGLTPNRYYVLNCIYEDIKPNKLINSELECLILKNDDWLDDELKLTLKSTILIEELNNFVKNNNNKASEKLIGDKFINNIEIYNSIFPNKKLPSGKYARVASKNLEFAFKWFFVNYNYSWDLIIEATEKYVDEFSVRNYEYMRTSQYFIRKQTLDKTFESELANYCELIKSGEIADNNYFKDNIV